MGVPEIARRFIGGKWQTGVAEDEGGGSPPEVESYTILAAEIAARWDSEVGAAFVQVGSFNPGDVILGAVVISDDNTEVGTALYFLASGLSSAAVSATADVSVNQKAASAPGVGALASSFGNYNSYGKAIVRADSACVGYSEFDAETLTGASAQLLLLVWRAA